MPAGAQQQAFNMICLYKVIPNWDMYSFPYKVSPTIYCIVFSILYWYEYIIITTLVPL